MQENFPFGYQQGRHVNIIKKRFPFSINHTQCPMPAGCLKNKHYAINKISNSLE